MVDDVSKKVSYLRKRVKSLSNPFGGGGLVVKLFPHEVREIADMLEQQQARIKELEKELDDWKAQGFDFSPDEY